MKLRREPGFDPAADLKAITRFAAAWRSQFRQAPLSYAPSYFKAELDKLAQAHAYRLYLVTRPAEPVALAIIEGLTPADAVDLMALAPGEGPDQDPDLVRPFEVSLAERRRLMRGAPERPQGRGVFAFVLGEPEGMAWLDLPAEGLVLAMARWGHLNIVDPAPLLAQRLRRLGHRLAELAARESGED